jgi:hypothetical protein
MRRKQAVDVKLVGRMTLHPSIGKDRTLMVEEKSVFHPTESRHD